MDRLEEIGDRKFIVIKKGPIQTHYIDLDKISHFLDNGDGTYLMSDINVQGMRTDISIDRILIFIEDGIDE